MRPIRSTTIALLLTSAVLATSLTGCQDSDEQQSGEILIGADLELSGVAAPMGQAYQRALELKIEQLNSSGTLGGRKIRLIVKDNRSDPSESARNIGDFTANQGLSAIVMGSCSDCAVSAAKTLNDQRIPAISLAPASTVANPVASRRYVFKLAPNAADSAAVLVSELKRQQVKKVALLHTDDDYGREGRAALDAELKKAKIDLVGTGEVKPTDTDVNAATRAVTSKEDPKALVVWTSAEQATLVAGAARQNGFTGMLFFDGGAAGDLFLGGLAGRAAENAAMVFTQTMVIDDVIATTPAKAARKQWFRDYTARYGGYYGLSSFAADAVTLIAESVVRTDAEGAAGRDQVRDVLETLQMEGLSGPIRMTPDNHSGLMPQALTMLVARDGRWRLAS